MTDLRLRGTFQRSLTSIVLSQIVIPIIPFAIINIYLAAKSSIVKSSYRLAQEALAFNITHIILYISCTLNLYVYLISAASYRRDFLQLVLFCDDRNNRIGTITREQL